MSSGFDIEENIVIGSVPIKHHGSLRAGRAAKKGVLWNKTEPVCITVKLCPFVGWTMKVKFPLFTFIDTK